jgi:hypothetical protein
MGNGRNSAYLARNAWQGEGPLTKFTVPNRKIDEEKRSITFTISTSGRDRDGDIISQDGWDLKHYLENPQVLWAHKADELPIARAANTKVINGKLMSEAIFATREEYEFADTVFRLYKGGFLNATSVGFVPTEMELIEGENPGELGFKFLKQNLLEFSAVAIPSNPEALVVARGRGIDVKPCEDWISKILDEQAGGSVNDLLNRSYIALKGRLHPIMQDGLIASNLEKLHEKAEDEAVEQPEKPANDEETERPVLSTAPGGDETHSHELQQGEAQTEGAEDDGHIHAVTYDDAGEAVLEPAEGHSHDLPPAANVGEETEEQPEQVAAASEPVTTKEFTDWPQAGMDMPVSLLTSEYRAFPLAEAKALQEDWPEIWALGDTLEFNEADSEAIRAREEWAARHVDDYNLEDVVAQVKRLVRGSRGIEYMRLMLSHAKEHVMNERDKAKGLSPEQIEAVTDRIVSKAVVPAIQKAFRQYSGRLS